MRILFLDDSFAYDGYTPRNDPMSGPEKGLVHLAEALARRGHDVVVRNRCSRPLDLRGVSWRSLDGNGAGEQADLAVALREARLFDRAPAGAVRVLWLAERGEALARRLQTSTPFGEVNLVFMSDDHRTSWPANAPRASVIRPGIAPPYLHARDPLGYWPPRAISTVHPRGGLTWLLDLWCARIEPLVSGAELHVFSGALARAASGKLIEPDLAAVFRRAEAAAGQGVAVRRPMPDADMAEEFRRARVFLHPGSPHECYAAGLAEAQAAGCPGVAFRDGAAQERILDGRTGFLARDDDAFANCAVLCLKEDIVYRGRSRDARDLQRDRSWDDVAAEFEAFAG